MSDAPADPSPAQRLLSRPTFGDYAHAAAAAVLSLGSLAMAGVGGQIARTATAFADVPGATHDVRNFGLTLAAAFTVSAAMWARGASASVSRDPAMRRMDMSRKVMFDRPSDLMRALYPHPVRARPARRATF